MRRSTAPRLAVLAVTALSLVAAACGDDDSSSDTTRPPAATSVPGSVGTAAPTTAPDADDVDPNGVLRLYSNLASAGGPDLDPSKVRVSPPTYIQGLIYDTLLRAKLDGTVEPGQAKSAEIVDPQTIRIELNEGIRFTDGTPLDAEAVKFGIERNRDAQNATLSAELQDIENITVESPTQLTLHLNKPTAGAVYDRLPYGDFMIVSPTAARNGNDFSANPIGAGPFVIERAEVGRTYVYRKNPDFFQADQIRLAGVEVTHIETGQDVTAIQSGAVDAAPALSYELSKALGGSGWEIETEATDRIQFWGHMCKSRPPFDDVRIRQAWNYAIDRDAINQAVLDGRGEPMWGFFVSGSPYHDPSLDGFYEQDQDRARQLLAEAGQPNLTFESFFTPGSSQRMAEIIQAQLAEIGVTMNLKPLTQVADFFPDARGAPLNIFGHQRTYIQKVSRNLTPPSVGNVCNWDDPEFNELVAQVKAMSPDDPAVIEVWSDLQRMALEKAMLGYIVTGVQARAYDPDRLGNPSWAMNFQGISEVDVYKVYIKK